MPVRTPQAKKKKLNNNKTANGDHSINTMSASGGLFDNFEFRDSDVLVENQPYLIPSLRKPVPVQARSPWQPSSFPFFENKKKPIAPKRLYKRIVHVFGPGVDFTQILPREIIMVLLCWLDGREVALCATVCKPLNLIIENSLDLWKHFVKRDIIENKQYLASSAANPEVGFIYLIFVLCRDY